MAYVRYTYKLGETIEHEYHYAGKYGAKGEKRHKKEKPTPEQIKRQNQYNKVKKVRRLILANFTKDDLWICLKYPRGTRKPTQEVRKDLRSFLEKLRKKYSRRGQELKFIYRLEIGRMGGIHAHVILNGIDEAFTLIQDTWTHGRVNFECLYDKGDYEQLASYIVKEPDEEVDAQMSFLDIDERKVYVKYSSSRNLIRPEPEVRKYSHWTMKRIIDTGPVPTIGYWIDTSSIRQGINQWTGTSYLYYTEHKIPIARGGGTEWMM